MSGAALGWAWKQPVPLSAAKFVLVALADRTTTDLAFMAVSSIARDTGLDRKTVLSSIARLVEWGFIEDTGERRGRTGCVPVYRLLMGEGLFDNAPYPPRRSSPKNGTGPKTGTASEAVPKLDGSGPNFPRKRSQNWDTDPQQIQDYPSLSPRAHAREAEPTNHDFGQVTYESGGPPEPPPTPAAAACVAMREAGMPVSHLNPSHPQLLAALDAGIAPSELADVVRELISRGTGPPSMVYVIRTAQGRRADAKSSQSNVHAPTRNTTTAGPARRPRSAIDLQADAITALRERRGTG